jgi:hypothetical protein
MCYLHIFTYTYIYTQTYAGMADLLIRLVNKATIAATT